MQIISKSENGWSLLQRIYSNRTKIEQGVTDQVLQWWETEPSKTLDGLRKILMHHSLDTRGILITTRPRGRYEEPPHHREFEIALTGGGGRAPFLVVGEPFGKPTTLTT